MYLSLCLFVIINSLLTDCVTVERYGDELSSKTKVELTPYVIKCLLSDIVIISAPELNKKSLYYLHSPNNEIRKLNIPRKNSKRQHSQSIIINYSNNITSFSNFDNYRVYSTKTSDKNDVLGEKEKFMRENEFMIGPLLESDHGNWVLSVFFKDLDDEYVEMFQVITVEIHDYLLLTPLDAVVKRGDTLNISFEYPIPFLETCQLTAPNTTFDRNAFASSRVGDRGFLERLQFIVDYSETCQLTAPNTTFDRFFDRNRIELDRCGYIVPNITKSDEGWWSITGVGRIIYTGNMLLTVNE